MSDWSDGDIHTTPLSPSNVLFHSFELMLDNFSSFCKIVLSLWIPTIVIIIWLSLALFPASDDNTLVLYYIILMSVTFLAVAAMNGAVAKVVGHTYVGIEMKVKDIVINVITKYMVTIFFASFFCYSAFILGLCLLVVPGLFVMVSLFLYDPAIALEGKGVYSGLARSWELTSGCRCEVLITIMMIDFFIFFVCVGWDLIIEMGTSNLIVQLILAGIPCLVLMPFRGIVKTVIYFNLRVQKEQLTQTQLGSELSLLTEKEMMVTENYEPPPTRAEIV